MHLITKSHLLRSINFRHLSDDAINRTTKCISTKTNSTIDYSDHRRDATQKWLDTIVIGQKLCPFASPVRQAPQLRIHISHGHSHDSIVKDINFEVNLLMGKVVDVGGNSKQCLKHPKHETTLVVLNEICCPSLVDFHDLIRLSWRVQSEVIVSGGLEDALQIVLFHPNAVHDTYSQGLASDPANYSIRSPYPTIHLLRQVDVMKAVRSGYPDLENLPSRNKAKLRADGIGKCVSRLKDCIDGNTKPSELD